jgi:hypothetical protein
MGVMDPINCLGEIGVDVLACGPAASRACPPRTALRATEGAPFTVIVDRADDVRFTRTVLASHHPAAGRVVAHPTVGSGDRLLWHDVLHAIADGRPLRAPACAARGNQFQQENSVRAALKAEAVRRLTILARTASGWDCGRTWCTCTAPPEPTWSWYTTPNSMRTRSISCGTATTASSPPTPARGRCTHPRDHPGTAGEKPRRQSDNKTLLRCLVGVEWPV